MKRLVESACILAALPPQTPSSAAPLYASLKYYNHLTIILNVANNSTGGTASAIALVQAQDNAGTNAKALAFDSVWKVEALTAISTSRALVKTAVTSNTFNTDSTLSTSSTYVIEIRADELDVSNGFDFVKVTVGNAAQATISATYILSEGRYPQATAVAPS